MSIIKNNEDLEKIRYSARILASCLNYIQTLVKPGVVASYLDHKAEEFILDFKARPSFKGLYGFPNTLITEIGEVVVHGTSDSKTTIPENCVVSFDCGVIYEGLYSDMAVLMTVGEVSDDEKMLVEKTKEALWAGINVVKAGKKVGDIGFAVDSVLQKAGLGNVLDLGGHGLGYVAHDEPHITHAGKPGTGARLFENQVIAIEPMVTLGSGEVRFESIPGAKVEVVKSLEGVPSAHVEHTILVTKKGREVLTDISESELLS